MEYKLIFDKKFTNAFRKLDYSIQIQAEKKIKKLKEYPREVGKPMRYFADLYELHVQMFRIFYIVKDNEVRVLLIGLEHKDECDRYIKQLTKDKIKQLIEENS